MNFSNSIIHFSMNISQKISQFTDQIHPSWKEALAEEFTKPYFTRLVEFIEMEQYEHTIYPPPDKIFTALSYPLDDVRVVVCGQDPYHGYGQAHGLAFSIEDASCCKFPPSLRNIFRELETDEFVEFKIPRPIHGNLQALSHQGVMLLNSVLSVREGQANSHKGRGWENFTDAIISVLNERKENLVFMLWGNAAKGKCSQVDDTRHYILTAAHPSPLSARNGFFGCNHFSQCNAIMEELESPEIIWQI